MAKRQRRFCSDEYKAEVVALVRGSGKSIRVVAQELDLTESAVRTWVRQAKVDSSEGPSGPLATAEREELAALRKRVKTLEMEREILKKRLSFSSCGWIGEGTRPFFGGFEAGFGQNPGLLGVCGAPTGPGSVGRVERRTRLLFSCG